MLLQIASLLGWTAISYFVVVSALCLTVVGLNARKRSRSRATDREQAALSASRAAAACAENIAIYVQPWLLDEISSDEDI